MFELGIGDVVLPRCNITALTACAAGGRVGNRAGQANYDIEVRSSISGIRSKDE